MISSKANDKFTLLTDVEMEAFEKAVTQPYFEWLGKEVFKNSSVRREERIAGALGFVFGSLGVAPMLEMGIQLGHTMMSTWDITNEQRNALATMLGIMILLPRIALSADTSQRVFSDLAHQLLRHTPLLKKKSWLRDLAILSSLNIIGVNGLGWVYLSLAYINANLPVRCFFAGISATAMMLVTAKPIHAKIDAIFARYNQGSDAIICEKRAALLFALNNALQVVRSFNETEFSQFYHELAGDYSDDNDVQQRWDKLLALAEQAACLPAESRFRQMRGYLGLLTAFLASLANIPFSHKLSDWLIGTDKLAPYFSLSAIIATTMVCMGPTKRYFEGGPSEPNWKLEYPFARTLIKYNALLLGFFSSLGLSYWAIMEGESLPEQLLAIPATISATALYELAFKTMLNNALDKLSSSPVFEHRQFLQKLESLPTAITTLPDQEIDNILPASGPVEHPVLMRYRAKHCLNSEQNRIGDVSELQDSSRPQVCKILAQGE